jgi:uncharacterized protein (DUF58 family)
MADIDQLLPETTRRQLETLMLIAPRVRAGAMKGDRRSIKRGTSIEFADYRNYVPGDDLRRLDWNIYARLDRPYIKLLEDEEDLAVHVVIDASASMDFPQEGDVNPAEHKLLWAKRMMAALAYVALNTNDRLLLAAIQEGSMDFLGPIRGRGQIIPMLLYADAIKPSGRTDLNAALREYASRAGRPGLCIIISDLFTPNGFSEGLHMLLGKGHEVAFVHVLSADEISPPLAGDFRLIDSETGLPQEVSVDATMRDLYMRKVLGWREEIEQDCLKRGVHYIPAETNTPFDQVLLYELRRLGIVK